MSLRPFAWEQSYPPGLSWDAPLDIGTVPALLSAAATAAPEAIALIYRDWRCSYGDLDRRVNAFGAALLRDGLKPGAPIALFLPNTPYHPIAFFGTLKAGGKIVHLSPLDAPRELAHKLKDSGARTIITTNIGPLAEGALKLNAAGLVDRVIVGDDSSFDIDSTHHFDNSAGNAILLSDFCADAEAPTQWPRILPEDVALLQYTGGTTGLPKGAMLSHANLTSAVSIYKTWFGAHYPDGADGRCCLCVLPLFHIYALTAILLFGVARHGQIILHPRFDPDRVLDDIERYKITAYPGVPTMWIALCNRPDIATRDLSSLQRCSSGGAPLPVEVAERFEALTGLRLVSGWGMTETSPAGTNILPRGIAKPGSIGLPLPGIDMRVVALDDPRRALPQGETGELVIKGPNVTTGYWNRPDDSANAFANGFFLTGDVGYMDADGYFYIVDRKKDMIISGGFNVYPQMIEQAIYEHPSVHECIVIGIADAYRGEAAKAYVSLRPGAAPFTLDELTAFLADKLGRHEMPAGLEIRAELPKTSVGKLSRLALRDEAANTTPRET